MCATVSNGEIIILSDEDEEEADESVLLVEVERERVVENNENVLPVDAADQDLVVTFSRCADLLPHARYDCPIQPFLEAECVINAPVLNNHLICAQCFCYICDKLASQCEMWSSSGMCHCNSHKRSNFWNNLRNSTLLGGLQSFNLTLCEIDSHLRHAEILLRIFKAELSQIFSAYLIGKPAKEYGLKLQGGVHDYTPVFDFVSTFLTLAEKQDSRAAAIMQLGAAEAFVRHYPASGTFVPHLPLANVYVARESLTARVISFLQRQMVMGELTSDFSHKLQEFYKKVTFPGQLKSLKNNLCVRPWEDVLLNSVLRGQNVNGVRKDKGKKDVLVEQISVVQLRMERLQQQGRYRELCRYLRVVQTEDPKIFQQLLDLMPFFLCADGQLSTAIQTLMTTQSSRLSPSLFLSYLQIFNTATLPIQILLQHSDLCRPVPWKPIEGAVPLKRVELVKFALKVLTFSTDVSNDSQCWISVLSLVSPVTGSMCGLPEPSAHFLQESKDLVKSIVLNQNNCNLHIPRQFFETYPDQALLLLLTEALAQRLLKGLLSPLLPLLKCFENNPWAQRWLWDSLSSCEHFKAFLSEMAQERNFNADKMFDFLITLQVSSPNADQ